MKPFLMLLFFAKRTTLCAEQLNANIKGVCSVYIMSEYIMHGDIHTFPPI